LGKECKEKVNVVFICFVFDYFNIGRTFEFGTKDARLV
jgi:hypothetical protein